MYTFDNDNFFLTFLVMHKLAIRLLKRGGRRREAPLFLLGGRKELASYLPYKDQGRLTALLVGGATFQGTLLQC